MTSSRVTRLGASVLLSLMLAAGLTSSALGVSPTDPTPSPTASSVGTATPGPTKNQQTTSNLPWCPPGWSSKLPEHGCSPQTGPSTETRAATTVPATATYTITGTVTGPGGVLLANVRVEAESDNYWPSATTDSNGFYIMNAPAGVYHLRARVLSGNYIGGYYTSTGLVYTWAAAEWVDVSAPVVANFVLPAANYITGTVTGPAGAPLDFVDVEVYSSVTGYQHSEGYGGAGGPTPYELAVPNGDYTVYFRDQSGTYLSGFYRSGAIPGNFTLDYGSATQVHVSSADTILPTVQLGTGHYISGRVTGTDGMPLVGISVEAFGSDYDGTATTGANGTYALAVPDDVYGVYFSDLNGIYISGYYNTSGFSRDHPTLITVAASVPGIDAVITPAGATYVPLTPTRLLDTRNGTGGLGVFHSHLAQSFQVAGGVVPGEATAVTGNLTVTSQTSLGFLYIGPNQQNDPTSSTLNFPLGDDRANAVIVGLNNQGKLWVTYAAPTLGPTANVIFDVTGYFVL